MNSKDLTVAAPSSATTNSATERYTIMRGSTAAEGTWDKVLEKLTAAADAQGLVDWSI